MMTSWFIKNILEITSGKDVTIDRNTTLNEKYNVLPTEKPRPKEMPIINYIGIGIGGMGDEVKTAYHSSIDTTLFEQIPYICRETKYDLSVTERANYRMRVVRNIGGKTYAFYYLKKLPQVYDRVTIRKLVKENSTDAVITDIDFDDPTLLNPVPRNLGEVDLNRNEFYVVDDRVSFNLTLQDKLEIKNAYTILYSDTNLPAITEVGIYYGSESVNIDGQVEAVAVRAAYFYAVPYELQDMLHRDNVTQRYIDVGGMRLR